MVHDPEEIVDGQLVCGEVKLRVGDGHCGSLDVTTMFSVHKVWRFQSILARVRSRLDLRVFFGRICLALAGHIDNTEAEAGVGQGFFLLAMRDCVGISSFNYQFGHEDKYKGRGGWSQTGRAPGQKGSSCDFRFMIAAENCVPVCLPRVDFLPHSRRVVTQSDRESSPDRSDSDEPWLLDSRAD